MRKILFLALITMINFKGATQNRPIVFGGIDYYRDTGFEENSYLDFNVGTQLFRWKFIAPEVGFEHYFGLANENNELNPNDPNARAPSKLKTRFSTSSLSLAPKLIFGNEEAALVIIPQYNFGKINARGDLLKDTGKSYVLDDQQKIKESISYFSIAAGVEGQFFDSEILHFSLFLKYNFLNSEETLKQIDIPQSRLNSNGGSAEGLGIGIRAYFDFIKLLKQ